MTNLIQSALKRCFLAIMAGTLLTAAANAAVPGITGPVFNLTAAKGYITQPDGMSIYSWGYGCAAGSSPRFSPSAFTEGACPTMQMPGPTLIVTEGDTVTVNLTNNLPPAAGNTSILFPGFSVTSAGGVSGLLTQEAASPATGTPSTTMVTYTFTANVPGTHSYYSGTRPDLQVEMGLFGALIVVPKTPAACANAIGKFSLSPSAYDNLNTCYDREYLFQFSELSLKVHRAVEAQENVPSPNIQIEPYHPEYFLVNGRSMPDDMDSNYANVYPHQPYNGNPHMHPGDLVLMRVIGQGRWQHPFHHHGNHARVLARDGNLITSALDPSGTALAGPLVFTVPTVSGQTVDAIFTWTGQGLNWDVYGHGSTDGTMCGGVAKYVPPSAGSAGSPMFDSTTKEYCPDHAKPFPITPADKNIVANGLWYGGSPYLGVKVGSSLIPGTTEVNTGGSYAYMWHSHDEREITTNDVFPGGMMMMLLIDPPTQDIDEQE